MTKTQAKKNILRALATTLQNDFYDLGAGYLTLREDGEPLSDADHDRMEEVVKDLIDEFRRRAP